MKITFHQIFFIAILLISAIAVHAQPTIYLVRHAEKLAGWPDGDGLDEFHPLSSEGAARAKKLAGQFNADSIAAIFSSRTTRALHTALPLSQKLKMPIEVADACMDTTAIAAFYKNLTRRFGANQAVILISHSNIIPYLLIKAGLPQACFQDIGIKVSAANVWLLIEGYDNIWQVKKTDSHKKNCNDFVMKKY